MDDQKYVPTCQNISTFAKYTVFHEIFINYKKRLKLQLYMYSLQILADLKQSRIT